MAFIGNLFSNSENKKTVRELSETTHFSSREIQRLQDRFNQIKSKKSGYVEKIPFLQQPEVAVNPFIHLAFDMEQQLFALDVNSSRPDSIVGIDFKHFVTLLSEFSPKATIMQKTAYFFKVLNADSNKKITKEEFYEFLVNLSYGHVPSFVYADLIDEIWETVQHTVKKDAITYDILSQFIAPADIHVMMTISY